MRPVTGALRDGTNDQEELFRYFYAYGYKESIPQEQHRARRYSEDFGAFIMDWEIRDG